MKKATVSPGDAPKTYSDNFKGFVNYSLTELQKNEAASWLVSADLPDLMSRIIDFGYKLSISMDSRHGRFIASLSRKEGENAGYILTARAGDVLQSIGRVLYLHFIVFDNGVWTDKEIQDVDQW